MIRLILFIQLLMGFSLAETQGAPVRVYTYDALTGKGSFAAYLGEEFRKKGGSVEWISFGTAGEALNQIVIEGEKTRADVIMGIDPVLFQKGADREIFEPVSADVKKNIFPELLLKQAPAFVPYDFGYLAFVYDNRVTPALSSPSLEGFVTQIRKTDKIVLQDPRTSLLGIEFLIWTREKLKSRFSQFWENLGPHILTVSPGWSGAYELFLRGQAQYVLSYTTSPAYHLMREHKDHIRAVLFQEGHFKQVEGLALLKTSKQKHKALELIRLVLSQEAQTQLPTYQWMYPVHKNVKLPKEFIKLAVPKTAEMDWHRVLREKEQWIKEWTLIMSKKSP